MPRFPTVGGDTDEWGEVLNELLAVTIGPDGQSKAHQHTIADVTGLTEALADSGPAPNPDFPPGQNVSYNVGGAKTGKVLVYVNTSLVLVSDDADPAGVYTRTVAQLGAEAPVPPTADIFPGEDLEAAVAGMSAAETLVCAPGDYGLPGQEFAMSGTNKTIQGLPGARWVGGQFRILGSGHTFDGFGWDQRSVPGKDVEITAANVTLTGCKLTNEYTGIKLLLGSGGRATDTLIEDCYFYNIGRSGLSNIFDHAIYAQYADDLIVRGCSFYNVIGGYCLHAYPDCQGSLFEDNKVFQSYAWVVSREDPAPPSSNNLMTNNAVQWTRTSPSSPHEAPCGRSSNGGTNNDIVHNATYATSGAWGTNGIDESGLDTISGNITDNPNFTTPVPGPNGVLTIQNATVSTFLGFS